MDSPLLVKSKQFALDIIKVCNKAKNKKSQFLAYMYSNYTKNVWDDDIAGTRTRDNCTIRIIESSKVEEALKLVLSANDNKLNCNESKINNLLVFKWFI